MSCRYCPSLSHVDNLIGRMAPINLHDLKVFLSSWGQGLLVEWSEHHLHRQGWISPTTYMRIQIALVFQRFIRSTHHHHYWLLQEFCTLPVPAWTGVCPWPSLWVCRKTWWQRGMAAGLLGTAAWTATGGWKATQWILNDFDSEDCSISCLVHCLICNSGICRSFWWGVVRFRRTCVTHRQASKQRCHLQAASAHRQPAFQLRKSVK